MGAIILHLFKEVEKKRNELENLRITIQATEITYRQKGEIPLAERFKKLETNLEKAIKLLKIED
jgi:hypothetical protein